MTSAHICTFVADIDRTTHLDSIDHLLGLVRTALVRNQRQALLQQSKLVLVLPIRLVDLDLCGKRSEEGLRTEPISRNDSPLAPSRKVFLAFVLPFSTTSAKS